MELTINLIRHGKTKAIEKNLYNGLEDIDITRKGRKELRSFRDLYPKADYYFCGELKRCVNSLKLIYPDTEFTIVPELNEQNLGKLDMFSFDAIKNIPAYAKWISDRTGDIKCPGGGESLNDFKLRTQLNFHKLIRPFIADLEKDTSLSIITHGSVIAVIMESAFRNKKTLKGWQPEPGRGYKLLYQKGNFRGYEVL